MKLLINVRDLESYKSRGLVPLECKHCSNKFLRPKHYILKVLNGNYRHITLDFCSKQCHWSASNKHIETTCATCSKTIEKLPSQVKKSKSGLSFCNKTCAAVYNNIHRTKMITVDYRNFALRHLENKCAKCGYDKYTNVLQVHHKDRNRSNNTVGNLQMLCPTCHQEHHFLEKTGAYTK